MEHIDLMGLSRRNAPERRRRIIAAARFLVLRRGLKATTMEAIAREAHIAKPTLYAYFPDRDAVFIGIVADLLAEVRQGVSDALRGDGDVIARVGGALGAKYRIVARTLEGSPHADALYAEHDRLSGPQVAALEASLEAEIAAALAAVGVARARPLAQLLLASAYGVSCRAKGVAEIGPAIRLLTERLLKPELEQAPVQQSSVSRG